MLSLTVMAMLLILCVGAAALLSMELRVARSSASMARAHLNAMAGARIALGEVQRLLGPDQRVSATAEILGAESVSDGSQSSAYDGPAGRVVHPRWVGVWRSDVVEDTDGPSTYLTRTGEGYLEDKRFAAGRNWALDRASATPSKNSRRFGGWLVSGNEALSATDSLRISPYATVVTADRNDALGRLGDRVLLGSGTLGSSSASADTNASSDMLGVRVPVVRLPDAAGAANGDFAYWVQDEGVKARFNVSDKFALAGVKPDGGAPGNGGYARLLRSQRNRFDRVRSEIAGSSAAVLPAGPGVAGRTWDMTSSFEDLSLIPDASSAVGSGSALRAAFYHDIGFVSAGIAADVVKGGLKKDLSAFLNLPSTSGSASIADYAGVANSGLDASSPIVREPTLKNLSPRFSLLRNWWLDAPAYAGNADPVSATSFGVTFTPYAQAHGTVTPAAIGIRTVPMKLPDFAKQERGARSPVLVDFSVNHQPAIEKVDDARGLGRTRVRIRAALWNPYATPLSLRGVRMDCFSSIMLYHIFDRVRFGIGGSPANCRSLIRMMVPDLVLQPGQTVSLVVRGQSDVSLLDGGDNLWRQGSPFSPVAYGALQVRMSVAGPQNSDQYFDSLMDQWDNPWVNLNRVAGWKWPDNFPSGSPYAGLATIFGVDGHFGNAALNFDETVSNICQIMIGNAAGDVYQQVNLNPYYSTRYFYVSGTNFVSYQPAIGYGYYPSWLDTTKPGLAPSATPDQHYGFRLKFIDGETDLESTGVLYNGRPEVRNVRIAPLADMNLRSPRLSRGPFDSLDRLSPDGMYAYGPWTIQARDPYVNTWNAPAAAPTRMSPFVSRENFAGTDYPAISLYDVPYREIGVLSLGQFRHAPMNVLPYGPSMPLGNSRIPNAAVDGAPAMTARTGMTANEIENTWRVLDWSNRDRDLRQITHASTGSPGIGAGTHDIYDIAFEQNYALWDGFTVSGIAAGNDGWVAGRSWRNDSVTGGGDRTLPDSRYQILTGPSSSAGYYGSSNYKLYKAADTLLTKGAFNVNSTSVVAWKSLLLSFRGLRVPKFDKSNAGSDTLTPFPRFMRPKAGVADQGATSSGVWSGFRALTDEEVDRLARKIVVEVKRRGPFLGLSDFINRRLRDPRADLAAWNTKEKDYLGAIDGAILAAGINDPLISALPMERETPDYDFSKSSPPTWDPAPARAFTADFGYARSKSRAAGAPGYLEQSDILQPLASVLTARSDTFTIRTCGSSEDGAVAYVEMVVQRMPEPLLPSGGTAVLAVNPRALISTAYAGNQLFGRRFKVASVRWLAASEI